MGVKIGIIEDDTALREGLKLAFELEGYETALARTFQEGQKLLEQGGLNLAILDCNLPDGNGFDLVKRLRKISDLPVLMLTARTSEVDEVQGLELGVDDFMRKPFSLAVLQARVRKLLKKQEEPRLLSSGGITLDLRSGEEDFLKWDRTAAACHVSGAQGSDPFQRTALRTDLGRFGKLCG